MSGPDFDKGITDARRILARYERGCGREGCDCEEIAPANAAYYRRNAAMFAEAFEQIGVDPDQAARTLSIIWALVVTPASAAGNLIEIRSLDQLLLTVMVAQYDAGQLNPNKEGEPA